MHNTGLSWASLWPHTATCFSFRRLCCRYRAWSTSGDFVLGLWSSAYSDTSRRNGTKSPWKSECNNFQAYCNYLNSNNSPIALFSKLFLAYRNRQEKKNKKARTGIRGYIQRSCSWAEVRGSMLAASSPTPHRLNIWIPTPDPLSSTSFFPFLPAEIQINAIWEWVQRETSPLRQSKVVSYKQL